MQRRRDENIYLTTARLRLAHRRNLWRYAIWAVLGASVFLGDAAINGYWKATTGHTMLECFILRPAGCDQPSMKIHGE